jgi:hypothetical protein
MVLDDLPFYPGCKNDTDIEHVHSSITTVLDSLNSVAKKYQVPVFMVPGNNDPWNGDYKTFSLPNYNTVIKLF